MKSCDMEEVQLGDNGIDIQLTLREGDGGVNDAEVRLVSFDVMELAHSA